MIDYEVYRNKLQDKIDLLEDEIREKQKWLNNMKSEMAGIEWLHRETVAKKKKEGLYVESK